MLSNEERPVSVAAHVRNFMRSKEGYMAFEVIARSKEIPDFTDEHNPHEVYIKLALRHLVETQQVYLAGGNFAGGLYRWIFSKDD
jgi:hypothetical protein